MFIKEDVKLNLQRLPGPIRTSLEELRQYDNKEGELTYIILWEDLEPAIKSWCIEGTVSWSDYETILEKYGGTN